MRYTVFALLGIAILSGCAPRKEVIIVKEKSSREEMKQTEESEIKQDTTAQDTTSYFKFTPDTTVNTEKTPELNNKNMVQENKVHGFRVQIFAFSSRERAEKAKEEAEQVLSLPVYIEYDPSIDGPYKVRVGDFTSREEAERYKEKLRQEGYPDAFIVETEVNNR